jgi:hypothetical protein
MQASKNYGSLAVDFINFIRARFSYECQTRILHVTRKKLPKRRSYEKFVCTTLMKLTPDLREDMYTQLSPIDNTHCKQNGLNFFVLSQSRLLKTTKINVSFVILDVNNL